MPVITEQELIDAAADALTLEKVVNDSASAPNPGHDPGTVTARLGATYKNVQRHLQDMADNFADVFNTTVENVGVYFDTRTDAEAANTSGGGNLLRTNYFDSSKVSGSGALYRRNNAVAITAGGFTSADGDIWHLNETIVSPLMFGAKGDGTTDDTAALQTCFDSGLTVFVPRPAVAYNITATLTLKTHGQYICGANMRSTLIRNTTNAAPLLQIGNPAAANGFAQAVCLEKLSFQGNAATTAGITVWSANAVTAEGGASWSSSSRNCSLIDLDVNEVGNGYAFRIYSWENSIVSPRLFSNNKRGFLFESEAQKNPVYDAYITDCEEESIVFSAVGIVRGNIFYSPVVQQSGGTDGCIASYGGQSNGLAGLYSESNNIPSKSPGTVVYIGEDSRNFKVDHVIHLSGGAIVVRDFGKYSAITNVHTASSLSGAVVQLAAPSQNAFVANITKADTATVPALISDLSTAKNATILRSDCVQSFTPSFDFVAAPTYTQRRGYLKITNGVAYFEIEIDYSGLDTSDTSSITITGLPALFLNGFGILQINFATSTGLNLTTSDFVQANLRAPNQNIELVTANGAGLAYNSGKIDAAGKIAITGYVHIS